MLVPLLEWTRGWVMRSVSIVVLGTLLSLSSLPARADVLVQISKAQQQLTVTVNGVETYRWRVSTGKPGYTTPSTYAVRGKQFVVVAAGGGKLGSKSSDTYVAFALP